MKPKNAIIFIVLFVLAGGFGWYVYSDMAGKDPQGNGESNTVGEEDNSPSISIDGDGEGTITPLPVEDAPTIPVPDLDRLVIDPAFPSDAAEAMREKLRETSEKLKENPDQLNLWIQLGNQRKIVNDYEGARDAWEYVSAWSPTNSISFTNLGNLYGYYLNDLEKAEENLLKAIENAPMTESLYFRAAEFYRDVAKDTEKARDIVAEGITQIPDSEALKSLLETLQQ